MTMNRRLVFLLVLFPAAASAQEGSIRFDRAVQYDFEVPEGWSEYEDLIPPANVSAVLLLFNESASLMIPAPVEEEEKELTGMERRAQGMAQRLRMGSPSRSDQEVLLEAYVSYEDGMIAETREFMGRTFLISSTQPSYAWKLTGEQSEFLGFVVHKATAVHDSAVIEAWFAPDIPVPAGPGSFGGLPGMILAVSVDDGHTVYSATEVNLDGLEGGAIKPPEEGQAVTREEYEQIVAEKLAELESMRRSRGRGDRQ